MDREPACRAKGRAGRRETFHHNERVRVSKDPCSLRLTRAPAGFKASNLSRPGRLACRRADSESGSELDSESDWPKPAWQPSCPLPVRLVTQRRRNHWHRRGVTVLSDSEDDPSPRLSPACSDCASCRRIPVVLAPRPVTGRPPRACPAHRRHRGPAAAAIGRAGPFRFRRVNAVCRAPDANCCWYDENHEMMVLASYR